MVATITILGADAQISGDFSLSTVIDATSYYQLGFEFTPRYKMGAWDGRIRLFKRMNSTFPSGLVTDVAEALRTDGFRVHIDDKRRCPPISPIPKDIKLHGVSFEYPYDYQLDCMQKMVNAQRGVVALATNAGKTECACLVTACLRLPTLFLVPGKELLYQTQKRFATRFGIGLDEVGIIGDGIWKPNQWITVAIIASLYEALKAGKPKATNLLDSTELLFADECHRVGSESWYEVIRACNAFFRFGMSGTPLKRSDGADLKLIAATGPIIYEVRNKFLIERGISSKAEIRLVAIRQPEIPKKTPYRDVYRIGITENLQRNRALCLIVDQLVKEGHKVVVMVREIEHGNQIDKRLWSFKTQSFLTHQFINGQEPTNVRQKALRDFEKGDLQVLIATSILDEGIDLPCIDAIVLAGGGKSSIKTLQRIGRGLRKGKSGKLIVVDTIDFQHHYLLEHSNQRLLDYRGEDCFTIVEHKVV